MFFFPLTERKTEVARSESAGWAGRWGRGMGSYCLMSTEFVFGMREKF